MPIGKPTSLATRQKALEKRRQFGDGRLISLRDKDDFKDGTFRALPTNNPDAPIPGVEYIGVYGKTIKKGTASPRTFGLPCPISDKIDEMRVGANKADKDAIAAVTSLSFEQYMAVVDRQMETDADGRAFLRVLPNKSKSHRAFIDRISNEKFGEEVYDPDLGRDFILKGEGSGFSREYSISLWLDPSPIFEDADMQADILQQAADFDVYEYICRIHQVNWDTLEEIHQALCGEAIPASYYDAAKGKSSTPSASVAAAAASANKGGKVVQKPQQPAAAKAMPAKPAPPPPAVDTVSPEGEDDGDVVFGETRVSFEAEGGVIEGTIIGQTADADGDAMYQVLADGDTDETSAWNVYPPSLTLIVAEPPEPEPEPVKPAPAPKPKIGGTKPAAPKAPQAAAAPAKPQAPKPAAGLQSGKIAAQLAAATKGKSVAPKPAVAALKPKLGGLAALKKT